MRINNNKQNFTSLSVLSKPLEAFYNKNAVIPTLAIESGVTILRSIEANKKGGKYEATERFIEQGVSAVVWLWGVQALKKFGDFLGSKILKLKDLNFDVGSDELRNPFLNNNISKKQMFYKSANILFSTALATIFIGFILPYLNRILTKKLTKNKTKKNIDNSLINTSNQFSFREFQKKTDKKNIAFTSLVDKTILLAHTLENNSTARLLITDIGVIAGRCHNAKTKSHKIENLFRDISSIYFYLFSSQHIVKILNKITSNADINPKALNEVVAMLNDKLKNGSISPQEFLNQALGNISKSDLAKLDELFKNKQTVTLEEFEKVFFGFEHKANLMSKLQSSSKNKILTKLQAKDVLSNGWSCEPVFLRKTLNKATDGASDDKFKFVSRKNLEKIRYSIDNFITQAGEYAKKKNVSINKELIEKVANKNIKKSFIFNTFATGVSIIALGIVIPVIQYKIRKKLTNKDDFPGDVYYK